MQPGSHDDAARTLPSRKSPRATRLRLVAIGDVPGEIIESLVQPLAETLGLDVVLGRPLPLHRDWYVDSRQQYDADLILDQLIARSAPRSELTLALLDADLFSRELRFVFGQATVGGCCGLVGLARLRPEFYGQPPSTQVFRRRLLTESVHEAGHLLGRRHCPSPTCVMHYSRLIEDSDRKGSDFCPRCALSGRNRRGEDGVWPA